MKKQFISALKKKKEAKEKIVMLTAYDVILGQILETVNIDAILVGDSLGNVVLGHETTIPVTVDDMIHHSKAVMRGVKKTIVITDMPFMSYRISMKKTLQFATQIMQETGVNGLKIEVNSEQDIATIQQLTQSGIPVMAHVGLTPQFVEQFGGFHMQGKAAETAHQISQLANESETAGAFSIVFECIPAELAKSMTQTLKIPTIGIGAGSDCDGQVLVTQDLLGLTPGKLPSFVNPVMDLQTDIKNALRSFISHIKETK